MEGRPLSSRAAHGAADRDGGDQGWRIRVRRPFEDFAPVARGDAHLEPTQEKRLQFAFALHVNAAARLQREETDEVTRDILGHVDSIW